MGRSSLEGKITYVPLPSQAEFHNCEARFKGFSGPVGSGKSQALCQEALRLCIQNQGRLGLLGAPTYPMLRAATQPTLFEILEENHISFDHNKAENMLTLNDLGSRILFRPVDEIERLRGTNLAWFGIDELTYSPEDAWLRLEARLRDPKASRLCGFGVWTPAGYDWVYRRFVAENRNENYQTVFAKPRENCHLDATYYDYLRASYDENFYRQEVLGEYINQNGDLVFNAFSRPANVVQAERNLYVPLLWSLDFNVNPLSSVVVQRYGTIVKVIDEITLRHASTIQACEEFLRRFGDHRADISIFGDCSGNRNTTNSEVSDWDIVKEVMAAQAKQRFIYRLYKSNPPVRSRVHFTNRMLRSAAGEVNLLVDPRCKELIMDFEQISYKEHSFEIDKDRDRDRTHHSDALGYLLWFEFDCHCPKKIGERPGRILSS
jgi:phage terminase large subunit